MLQLGWLENLLRAFLTLPLSASLSSAQNRLSAALKLLNNQHGPAPLTRLMCTHFPGTRRRLGGEFEEGATARGGEVGSSELARCLGHHHHHHCQPHPLRALGSLHVLGHPQRGRL